MFFRSLLPPDFFEFTAVSGENPGVKASAIASPEQFRSLRWYPLNHLVPTVGGRAQSSRLPAVWYEGCGGRLILCQPSKGKDKGKGKGKGKDKDKGNGNGKDQGNDKDKDKGQGKFKANYRK